MRVAVQSNSAKLSRNSANLSRNSANLSRNSANLHVGLLQCLAYTKHVLPWNTSRSTAKVFIGESFTPWNLKLLNF